jgi:hypothetical protein
MIPAAEPWPARFGTGSRNATLTERLAARLPARPHLLAIGAGDGGLIRWLAPRLRRPQVWQVADLDVERIERAYAGIAQWAESRGWAVTFPSRAMLVHTPDGAWRLEGVLADIVDPVSLPAADAVLCDALLSRVSADWVAALAETRRTPVLATQIQAGSLRFLPAHPLDRAVCNAAWRALAAPAEFGSPLGAHALATATRIFTAQGFKVSTAPSDWQVPRHRLALMRALVTETAALARTSPACAGRASLWEKTRLRQALAGRLAFRLGQRDLLAEPR